MNKTTRKIIMAFAVILVIAAVIIFVFLRQKKTGEMDAENAALPSTEAGKLLAKDLDTKYPQTPTEVLKLYWRINTCMYHEETSDEDARKLLEQLRKLYDSEFLKGEGNSFDEMFNSFKADKEKRLDAKQSFYSYIVQKNNSVVVKKVNNVSNAEVITATLIGVKGEGSQAVYESFLCRKDLKNKWRILGWQQVSSEEAEDAGVSINVK